MNENELHQRDERNAAEAAVKLVGLARRRIRLQRELDDVTMREKLLRSELEAAINGQREGA